MPQGAQQVHLRSWEVVVEGQGSSWSWYQVLACSLSVWWMGEHPPLCGCSWGPAASGSSP